MAATSGCRTSFCRRCIDARSLSPVESARATENGGADGYGAVFEIVRSGSIYSGTPTVLTSLNSTNGATPIASLIMDAAGNLFGSTQYEEL